MKLFFYYFLILTGFLFITSCDSNNDSTINNELGKKENNGVLAEEAEDKEFMEKAASVGMMEVELGNLILQKGTSAEVKAFAKKMVDDHSKVNEQLKSLAAQKNITLRATMVDKHKKHLTDFQEKKTGKNFDEAYMG